MDREDQDHIYELMLNKIKSPRMYQTIWSNESEKLGVCFIEFRSHKWIKPVLYNMCNVYGGTDVCLYIIHGTENEQFIKDIVYDWKNVKLIKLPFSNLLRSEYNQVLTKPSFYELFQTEFILIFQLDTLIRKRIPDRFFNYKYVGAPWKGYPNDYPDNPELKLGNKLVGNGGFSLRNVKRMIQICTSYTRHDTSKLNEDVFISNLLEEDEVPNVDIAKQFSVEWIYDRDPVGLHHVWTIYPIETVRQWLVDIC
jgi:hypothetical protein